MSITSQIFWPSFNDNVATIAPLQTVGADLTVKIRSNQPNQPNVSVNDSGVYYYNSMLRTVSINSVHNWAATNFFITGLSAPVDGNGNPSETLSVFTETIPGPNPAPSETARVYARIDSITTSTPIPDPFPISVGFGTHGITAYTFLNMDVSPPQHWAFQGQPINAAAGFRYTFYGSLTVPEIINTQYGNLTPFPHPIPSFPLLAAPASVLNTLISNLSGQANLSLYPFIRLGWANINDSGGDGNASFYYTFYQQGIAR